MEFQADGLGRTTEKREDLGSSQAIVTKWEYDAFDQVTKLTDDNSSDTVYAWNVLGQLTQRSCGNSKTVACFYEGEANDAR